MTHESAKRELELGTPAAVICATCPWDRLCVEPPAMTARDVRAKVDEAMAVDERRDPEHRSLPVGGLLTALIHAGKDQAGKMCPVFALRLRGPDGRAVADAMRQMMRAYDEPTPSIPTQDQEKQP